MCIYYLVDNFKYHFKNSRRFEKGKHDCKQGHSSWSWVHFTRVADNATIGGLFHLTVIILCVCLFVKVGILAYLLTLHITIFDVHCIHANIVNNCQKDISPRFVGV